MAILSILTAVTGLAGVRPKLIYVDTDNTVAQVTTAGYLNQITSEGYNLSGKEMALVSTKLTPGAVTSSTNLYSIAVAAGTGIITLTEINGLPFSLPVTVAEGGTALTTLTPYSLIAAGTTATGAMQQVASLGTSGQVLTSNGAGALPTWQAGSVVTPAALTEVNDTNVTLTLGGTPATALLQAASITAGWTGQLAVPRGGSGLASLTAYAILTGGTTTTGAMQQVASVGTAGQVLTSAGAGALPTWSTTGSVSSGLINQVAWYAATGTALSGITIVNSAGLLTSAGGVPGWVAYTGTGAPVLATSPTLITPILGAATATSLVFSPTTSGIIGVTDASNAGAGFVGQIIQNVVLFASKISLTNTVVANLTSISLTAGDWDVYGNVFFAVSAGADNLDCWISLTSATAPDEALISYLASTNTSLGDTGINTPYFRASVSSTTTVYISALADFPSGTVTMCGGVYARRVR